METEEVFYEKYMPSSRTGIVAGWILGLFFIVVGWITIIDTGRNFFGGVTLMIVGINFFPPTRKYLLPKKKLDSGLAMLHYVFRNIGLGCALILSALFIFISIALFFEGVYYIESVLYDIIALAIFTTISLMDRQEWV